MLSTHCIETLKLVKLSFHNNRILEEQKRSALIFLEKSFINFLTSKVNNHLSISGCEKMWYYISTEITKYFKKEFIPLNIPLEVFKKIYPFLDSN